MQEHRHQRLAGNAERAGVRRMQVADAHGVGPVTVYLRVNAPFQRDESARMFDDGAVDVVNENLLGTHGALFRAGAGADEAFVGARHADGHVAEHSDRALQIQDARQRRGLFAQKLFIAHEKAISVCAA